MNIFLRYEITARELDANILTGLIAASKGHKAIVCDWPMMMRGIWFRRRQSGFVHMNSLTPGKSALIFHRIFHFFGYRISSMDQEAGIQLLSYEGFAKVRYGEATVASADLIFCWGRDDYEALVRLYPHHRKKIVMSGSPRVDLWRPRFSGVYAKPKQAIEPFVLIVSSVLGPVLASGLSEILMNHRRSVYHERNPEMLAQLVGQFKEGADLMLAYLDLVRLLTSKYPDMNIVVKPHPTESVETWRGILGETERLRIDTGTPTSQLVRESMAVILSGSTVAFEAELAEKPLISFQPFEMPHRNLGFADSLGVVAKTIGEVDGALSEVLKPQGGQDSDIGPKPSAVGIKSKLHFEETELAAERMVSAWESALGTESQQRVSRSIFFMSREELVYFFASAYPFLTALFSRNGRLLRATKKNQKRPPQSRHSLESRVDNIRTILGLQDVVSYRFAGRRGLVFVPRNNYSHVRSITRWLGSIFLLVTKQSRRLTM